DAFVHAAGLMAGDAKPLYLAASALDRSGKSSEAITEYRAAANLAPKNATIRLGLGGTLLRAAQYPEAEAQFRDAVALEGGSQAWLGLAEALFKEAKDADAAQAYATYLKASPDDRQARLEYAAALRNTNRLDEAIGELDRAGQQDAVPNADLLRLR